MIRIPANVCVGNELYEIMQALADAVSVLPCRDFNVFVDRSSFIEIERLREMTREETMKAGVNLMKCDKVTSEQNRGVQLVDYVAGAARADVRMGTHRYT